MDTRMHTVTYAHQLDFACLYVLTPLPPPTHATPPYPFIHHPLGFIPLRFFTDFNAMVHTKMLPCIAAVLLCAARLAPVVEAEGNEGNPLALHWTWIPDSTAAEEAAAVSQSDSWLRRYQKGEKRVMKGPDLGVFTKSLVSLFVFWKKEERRNIIKMRAYLSVRFMLLLS